MNDIADLEKDIQHPRKKNRPIASGELKVQSAVMEAGFLTLIILVVSFYLSFPLGAIMLMYIFLNYLYSYKFKNVFIIDVCIISIGFALRALAGSVVIHVRPSSWLVILSFLLALFLAFNKRKIELNLLTKANMIGECSIYSKRYSITFLNLMIMVTGAGSILIYSLYTFNSVHSNRLAWSIPFVIYGILKYWYLSHQNKTLEEIVFRDRPFVINMMLWLGIVALILSVFNRGT